MKLSKNSNPNYHRRARHHDYTSPCIYMITLSKPDGIPAFSQLHGALNDPTRPPCVRFSPVGLLINYEIKQFNKTHTEAQIKRWVIMPDHIHYILYVKKKLDRHMAYLISQLKTNCHVRFRDKLAPQEFPEMNREQSALFTENYHDRILSRKGQLQVMNDYIADNPRRLLVKRLYPDLFRRRRKICFCMNGEKIQMEAFGNTFLLDDVLKVAVKVSRKYSTETLAIKEKEWEYVIDNDGVLISPFINKREKHWRDRAMEEGGRLVILRDNGFTERYAPPGRFFDLCAEGRLLLLAPLCHDPRKERQKILKSEADRLNEIALFLTGSWRDSTAFRG